MQRANMEHPQENGPIHLHYPRHEILTHPFSACFIPIFVEVSLFCCSNPLLNSHSCLLKGLCLVDPCGPDGSRWPIPTQNCRAACRCAAGEQPCALGSYIQDCPSRWTLKLQRFYWDNGHRHCDVLRDCLWIYNIYTINDVMVVSSSSKKTGATLWTKPLDPLSEAFA